MAQDAEQDHPPLHPTRRWMALITSLLWLLVAVSSLWVVNRIIPAYALGFGLGPTLRNEAATGGPALFVQGGLTARAGELAQIPLAFENNGAHVSSLSFSLDYDRDCLAFEPDDQDGNGLPDAISFAIPAQFTPSVIVKADGRDELHIVVADYRPPFAALPSTAALVTVRLRVICTDPAFLPRTARVTFFTQPPVSFSDENGRDLPGQVRGGVVQILPPQAGVTPAPSATPTIVTTAPATPSLVPTSITPTPTPWVHLEARAAPDQLTIADTNLLVVIDYALLLPVSDLALLVTLPPQVQLNPAASTVGWQCPAPPATEPCRFPLPSTAVATPTSGRLFLALAIDWLVLPIPTQFAFPITAVSATRPDMPGLTLTIPIFAVRRPEVTNALELELQADREELLVEGTDAQAPPSYQVTYQLTYTNRSELPLVDVDLRLLLPGVTSFQPTDSTLLGWQCTQAQAQDQEQPVCTTTVDSLPSGVRHQESFVLQVAQVTQLRTQTALALVAYATSAETVLDTVSSVVPIRYDLMLEQQLFLPLIVTAGSP